MNKKPNVFTMLLLLIICLIFINENQKSDFVMNYFIEFKQDFITIAEYVSTNNGWYKYLNSSWDQEYSYKNAIFLPETVKKSMNKYYSTINRYGSIYKICDEGRSYFDINSLNTNGTIFEMSSKIIYKDYEGCDIREIISLVYIDSDSPNKYLNQIKLGIDDSIVNVCDEWYIITLYIN